MQKRKSKRKYQNETTMCYESKIYEYMLHLFSMTVNTFCIHYIIHILNIQCAQSQSWLTLSCIGFYMLCVKRIQSWVSELVLQAQSFDWHSKQSTVSIYVIYQFDYFACYFYRFAVGLTVIPHIITPHIILILMQNGFFFIRLWCKIFSFRSSHHNNK